MCACKGDAGASKTANTSWCINASLLEKLLPDSRQPLSLLLGFASQQLALPLQLSAPLQPLCFPPFGPLLLQPFFLLTLSLLLFFLHHTIHCIDAAAASVFVAGQLAYNQAQKRGHTNVTVASAVRKSACV